MQRTRIPYRKSYVRYVHLRTAWLFVEETAKKSTNETLETGDAIMGNVVDSTNNQGTEIIRS